MIAAVARSAYRLVAGALTLGIVVLSGFLLLVALPDLAGDAARIVATPSPAPTPTPAPSHRSAMARSPIGIEMPEDADCSACHLTTSGTVGTREIPRMGHPVWGWRDCTACHATGSLVRTASGHTTLHQEECLVCHQPPAPEASAGPRPEHMGTDRPCIACHGVDEHAPMPRTMAERNNCWVCHNGPEFEYLFEDPPASPAGDADDGTAVILPDGTSRWARARTAGPDGTSYRLEAGPLP